MLAAETGKPLWGDGSAVESDLYLQMGTSMGTARQAVGQRDSTSGQH